jgi:two-component system, NarL family, nitrate/nitrite response regulator NarL
MMKHQIKTRIGLCETQPTTAEGIRSLLAGTSDLECRWSAGSAAMALALLRQQPVDVLLADKTYLAIPGPEQTHFLEAVRSTAVVVWSQILSEPEALRLIQAGVRGILRKSADLATVLQCFRTVAEGGTWMEDSVFQDAIRLDRPARTALTSRERQVLELVEQGMRNKDIADELGIRPGTVKIHMKHIFEKTGVHGRYGLALSGLRQRGLLAMARTHESLGERNGEFGPRHEPLREARTLKAS